MSDRDYYLNNREAIIKRVGAWQARNVEKVRAIKARSRKKVRSEKPYRGAMYCAKARALKKFIKFDLTEDWAKARWTGKCELTGAPFDVANGRPTAFSASLDRIDGSKGYTQDNCRFILWSINRFKSDYDDATMMRIARLLVGVN